ncbi:MAG: sensor histidine kinase [Zoogloea sp.]|uniref:sensor histidine kinase n=1 Tax=Zoogloea sp. TaxID=49181 RepID=UPI003F39CCD6
MAPSLRKALLVWLLLPATLALITFLPLAYHLVHQPAMEALDQALADASLALIPHLEVTSDGEARFTFPIAAEHILRADRVDEIYYLVLGPEGHFIAGDQGLPFEDPEHQEVNEDRISFDAHFRGHPIRVLAIRREIASQTFMFITAETTRKRDQLRVDLAFALILPLMFFAGATGLTIWFAVRHALLPIEDIRRSLQGMGHHALRALDARAAPTEIRPLVAEFNHLLDRLEQASGAQQRFVANAAHQLRTPLAGVRTQLELLQTDHTAEQRLQRTHQCIGAIERLTRLVGQMLVLLSAEPGGRSADLASPLDLPELIRERSPEWVRLASSRNLDLGFELAPAHLQGDTLLVGEMIANLVVNALSYTPSPGEVTLSCGEDAKQVWIQVDDTGPGIPPQARLRVFERFYRLPGSSSPGSGLGLSIVQEIAQSLGGSASIHDRPEGPGCRVRVSFPCPPAEPTPS